MTKQIKPHQIINRIEETINTQKTNGYRAGWVYHQLDNLVEKNWKNLCHAYDASQIASHALHVARGEETLEEVKAMLEDSYEIYQEEMEMYG